jgi:fatty acid desaturase
MTSARMSADPSASPRPHAGGWPAPVSPDELKLALRAASGRPGGPRSFLAILVAALLLAASHAAILTARPLLAALLLIPANLALAILQHECAHATLLPWRRAHLPLGALIGVFALCPFGGYRRGHIAHHRHTGLPGLDPTISRPIHPALSPLLTLIYRARILPVFYWAGVFIPYLCYDLRSPRSLRRLLAWAASLLLSAAWIAALAHAAPSPAHALIPLAIGFIGAGVLYEHLFTMHQHIGLATPPPPLPHGPRHQPLWTRSVPMPRSALLLHFNLHKEHHLAPGLPWHQLPALRAALRAQRPDLYTFTRQDHALLWRRDQSALDLLTPRAGDPPS